MCQLLGMNCATPTDFTFSFRGFCRRGGDTDKHEHGWGMAIYEGHGVRTFLDTLPAARSPVASFVASYPIQTLNTMAHIRYATHGKVALENVHPFQREMWGIIWTFAHNGEVPKFSNNKPYQEYPRLGRCGHTTKKDHRHDNAVFYHPVGDTDSEATFCAILNALRTEFSELPTLPVLYETLQRLCAQIVEGDEELTILNFLLGCGPYTLFAYSWPGARPGSKVWNGLFYTIRKPPFLTARLVDVDYSVDFAQVTSPNDRVAVIATAPLTVDEEWKEFRRGELLMFDNGLSYSELHDCLAVEKQGRGLYSKVMRKKQLSQSCSDDEKYDLPTKLRRLLEESVVVDRSNETYARAADLGCGAGCSGLAFRSCCRHLTGVDLSPAMLEKAREVGCYDDLALGDIDTVLQERQSRTGPCSKNGQEESLNGCFDLIFACNVFVYIQDLRPIFQSVQQSLKENGVFAFSAELLSNQVENNDNMSEEPYVLQSCARYAHTKSNVEDLASEFGFRTIACKGSSLRKHEGRDVDGVLTIMTLQADK